MRETNEARRREILMLLDGVPDSDRLVRAYQEALEYITTPDDSPDMAERRREISDAIRTMARLEREIRELRAATENRWDGRSSAFLQADAVAAEDRRAWLGALEHLAELMSNQPI